MIKKILKWPLIVIGFLVLVKFTFTLLFFIVNKSPLDATAFAPAVAPSKEKFYISSFSPDSKKLYLEFAGINRNVNIGWMDLLSKQVSLYVPGDTQDRFASPSSSADGKQLAVVIKEAANNFEISQIGVIDLESNSYRAVTKSDSFKQFPSFSPDGKKIIYGQSNRIRESGKTRFSDWDIYEVEISTGIERRLTNFCFFEINNPFYFNEGNKFVFSGTPSTCLAPDYAGYQDSQDFLRNYEALYQKNHIFMMIGNETRLKPFLMNGPHANGAFLAQDGKIFFVSRTNEMDGLNLSKFNFDIFVYEVGTIKRLTNLKTYLSGLVASPKGDLVVYKSDPLRKQRHEYWMMDTKNGTHNQINFGDSKSFQHVQLNKQLK